MKKSGTFTFTCKLRIAPIVIHEGMRTDKWLEEALQCYHTLLQRIKIFFKHEWNKCDQKILGSVRRISSLLFASLVFSLLAERKSSISLTVDNFRRFDSLQGHFLPRSQHHGTPPVARLAVNPPAAVRVVLNTWVDSVFPGETVDSPARK